MQEHIEHKQLVNSGEFWENVKNSLVNGRIVNEKPIQGNEVNVMMAVCPLYAPGNLSSNSLLKPPMGIEESRVSLKLSRYKSVLSAMQKSLKPNLGKVKLTVVFADKGVLMSSVPQESDVEALDYHQSLYLANLGAYCEVEGIEMANFTSQSALSVDFPSFVSLGGGAQEVVRRSKTRGRND